MDDSQNSNTSWNKNFNQTSFNYSDAFNDTDSSYDEEYRTFILYCIDFLDWITIFIGLPLTLLAMYAVLLMLKKDHGAPVYIFNLLISDIIQLCSRIPLMLNYHTGFCIYAFRLGLIANVGFMVCVSLERYLIIARPLWYRFRQNITTSLMVCVAVWIFSLLFIVAIYLPLELRTSGAILGVFLLLPLPLLIFFLIGSIKALSESSVPTEEKRRIISILFVLLLIYVLLFLPIVIFLLIQDAKEKLHFEIVGSICQCLGPLADSAIYIFLRRGSVDRLLASCSCCKMSNNLKINSTDNENMSVLCTSAV